MTNTCGLADRLSCARQRLLDLGRKLAAILGRIHDLRAGQSNAVLVTGYWNVFEDGDMHAVTSRGRVKTRATS